MTTRRFIPQLLAAWVLFLTGCGSMGIISTTIPPTPRSTSTPPPILTPTATYTPVPTLSVGEKAHVLAEKGVTANADWIPYTEEFNGVKMALVPAGCFPMGSSDEQVADAVKLVTSYLPNIRKANEGQTITSIDPAIFDSEKPVHKVCFNKPFWIDVTEVTNGQFKELGGEAGRKGHWSDEDRPRDATTWDESNTFCQKRGARLPTEAEWEYAARGPDGLIFPWGNTWDGTLLVWNPTASGLGPKVEDEVVGSKPGDLSWIGAYDMAGNVGEWVNDWFSATYYATLPDGVINPQGPETGVWQTPVPQWVPGGTMRSIRGGEWYTSDPFGLRAAMRGRYLPDSFSSTGGFRCAMSY
jgi:formylglycine-generating enzyme required for sulfatase activity